MNDVDWILEQLWAPVVAVTAAHEGRASGLISSTVVTAGLLPEAPRISVQLARANLTHDVVLASGAFAVHLLAADDAGLEMFRTLGFRSGHAGAKLDRISTRLGETGSPILVEAAAYVEARVADTIESDDVTFVRADVLGGGRLRDVPILTIEDVRARAPAAWHEEWEARRVEEIRDARRFRR